MHTDYYSSAESMAITRRRALEELRAHGVRDTDEFYRDLGDQDSYQAQEVLLWLGY